MQLTEDILRADLALLNHGGQEAISLFLEMSRRLHEAGDAEALRDWVVVAAPALPEKERAKVRFTHLNHTNPVLDPDSSEASAVRNAGCFVAIEGERFDI